MPDNLKPDAEMLKDLADLITNGGSFTAREVRQRILTYPAAGQTPDPEPLRIATAFSRAIFPQAVITKGNGQFLDPRTIQGFYDKLGDDPSSEARRDQIARALTQGNNESDEEFHGRVVLEYVTKASRAISEDRTGELAGAIVKANNRIEGWHCDSVSEVDSVRASLRVLAAQQYELFGRNAPMTPREVEQTLMSIARRDVDEDWGGDRSFADLVGAFNELVTEPELAEKVVKGTKTLTEAENERKGVKKFTPPEPDEDPEKKIKREAEKHGEHGGPA